jgi:hypothetical protein
LNRRGGSGFPGDQLPHSFLSANMGGVALQSPVMSRNHLLASPGLGSPQLMSPGMLMSQMSPDMQLSGRKMPQGAGNRMNGLLDASEIPAPQVHQQQFDQVAMNQINQQMMMNAGMGNDFSGNQGFGMSGGMMNSQQQLNHKMSQMNQMNQQLQQQQQQQQQQHNANNQSDFAEMQMLQNKLQAIYSNSNQFDLRPVDQIPSPQPPPPPPPPPQPLPETPRQRNSASTGDYQQNNTRVEIPPGNNPRRMPPPSLLKRDDSLRMDKIFTGNSPTYTKRKYDGNGSSAHLSAMSLSLGDMNEEGNLSSVFDSSLRISTASADKGYASKDKLKDSIRSSGNWSGPNLDMSVATMATGATDQRYSETGNMSFATLGDPKLQESEGNMSFSKVFEDPDKLG